MWPQREDQDLVPPLRLREDAVGRLREDAHGGGVLGSGPSRRQDFGFYSGSRLPPFLQQSKNPFAAEEQKLAYWRIRSPDPELQRPPPPPPPQQQQQLHLLCEPNGFPAVYQRMFMDLLPKSKNCLLKTIELLWKTQQQQEPEEMTSRLQYPQPPLYRISSQEFQIPQPHQQCVRHQREYEEFLPELQNRLVLTENQINEYKHESQVDQCGQFSNQDEKFHVEKLVDYMQRKITTTEHSACFYMNLRFNFHPPNFSSTSSAGPSVQTTGTILDYNSSGQPVTGYMPSVSDFRYGLPTSPSPTMVQTFAELENYLTECCHWIKELVKPLLVDLNRSSSISQWASFESIPDVGTLCDYFIYVSSKLEDLEQEFKKAATFQAIARGVHPSSVWQAKLEQSSTPIVGSFASSKIPESSTSQKPQRSSPVSRDAGFSMFSTSPSVVATSSTPSKLCTSGHTLQSAPGQAQQ